MAYEVKKISSRKSLNEFLRLPFLVYKGDPYWVAPITSEIKRILNPTKNPYFHDASLQLFNCYKKNKVCSRIAIIINRRHQKKFGKNVAFFGFFESLNDVRAIDHLFHAVEKYCKGLGIETIEGPYNPNHYSELGFQTNQFSTTPTFFQPYNPDYYCRLFEDIGFQISAKFHTRKNEYISKYIKEHDYNFDRSSSNGFNVRPFDIRKKEAELERLRFIMNDAFSENWHFLPLSSAEYEFSSKYLSLVTPPNLIQFVEYDSKPVAAIHFTLDINPLLKKLRGHVNPLNYLTFTFNKKKIRKLIIFSVGIRKSFRHSPCFALLLEVTANIAANYDVLETTWTSKDNKAAIRAAEYLGLTPDKELVIYKKQLI
jgi:hypothetical protein